jgi:hypothetical protein
MDLLRNENKILMERQEANQKKFEDIYENHILISKDNSGPKNNPN